MKQKVWSRTVSATPEELADEKFLDMVSKGEIDEVVRLLANGQEPSVSDERGETALHKAVQGGDVQLVGILLDAGAIIDHADCDGVRPITLAVRANALGLCLMLLDRGASLTYQNVNDGSILLHDAAHSGHVGMMAFLLQTGEYADMLETTDMSGRTPLHIAAFRAPEEVCRMLVAAGAQPNVVDERKNKPSALAGYVGRRKSKDFLLSCEGALNVGLAAVKIKRHARHSRERVTDSSDT